MSTHETDGEGTGPSSGTDMRTDGDVVPGATAARRARLREAGGTLF
ncbi:hypothetical protein [Actinomyces viscosus]|nr:hypothetical protein [Actinomyces viscosus]